MRGDAGFCTMWLADEEELHRPLIEPSEPKERGGVQPAIASLNPSNRPNGDPDTASHLLLSQTLCASSLAEQFRGEDGHVGEQTMQRTACQQLPALVLIPLMASRRFHAPMGTETFEQRLRRLLAERDMTQEEFYRRTGASMRTVTGWLAGTQPMARWLEQIAEALGVTTDGLLRGIDWGQVEPATPTEVERGAADAREAVDRAQKQARSGTRRRKSQGQGPPQSA